MQAGGRLMCDSVYCGGWRQSCFMLQLSPRAVAVCASRPLWACQAGCTEPGQVARPQLTWALHVCGTLTIVRRTPRRDRCASLTSTDRLYSASAHKTSVRAQCQQAGVAAHLCGHRNQPLGAWREAGRGRSSSCALEVTHGSGREWRRVKVGDGGKHAARRTDASDGSDQVPRFQTGQGVCPDEPVHVTPSRWLTAWLCTHHTLARACTMPTGSDRRVRRQRCRVQGPVHS